MPGRLRHTGGRRFGFDEFDLRVCMAKFREFGLEQRVVARVVHETKVIFKFGIEANRKNVFLERNRMRIHEIAAGERTDAANGFHQPGPQPGQIGGYRRVLSAQGRWSARATGCRRVR